MRRLIEGARARARAGLRGQVEAALAARRRMLPAVGPLADEARQLEVEVAGLRRELGALRSDLELWGRPFSAEMTVDQAWRRHPRAGEVFARFHLPACDGCAVRFDETLEEAAASYGLDLVTLLAQLDALLAPSPPASPR